MIRITVDVSKKKKRKLRLKIDFKISSYNRFLPTFSLSLSLITSLFCFQSLYIAGIILTGLHRVREENTAKKKTLTLK